MNAYQLSRMVQRRGYRLEDHTMKPPRDFDVLRGFEVIRGEENIAQISVFALERLQASEIPPFLDKVVSLHHPMQHHIRCRNCHAPLLSHQNTDITEYRDAEQGPASEPLTRCPVCLLPLDERNVVGIVDPEIPSVKAAFDFQHTMAKVGERQRKLFEQAKQGEA